MRSGRTREDLNADRRPENRSMWSKIRRMVVDLSDGGSWRVKGYELLRETFRAEVFGGVGFYSRPAAGSAAEAIAVNLGDAEAPVLVATRDEGLRQRMAGDLGADCAAMFNTKAGVFVLPNGTVEIRTENGAAVPLATKADLEELKDAIVAWTPAPNDGGAALKVKLLALWTTPKVWPVGTMKLKGE